MCSPTAIDNDGLWKDCVNWLSQFGPTVMNPDLQILNSKSLFNYLRSGVVLCRLIHHIEPDSINLSLISKRPQNSRFLCIENIRMFLYGCKNQFGMRERELFDPYMLYEGTDFGQVLQALSNLSKRETVTNMNFRPFPVDPPDPPNATEPDPHHTTTNNNSSNHTHDSDFSTASTSSDLIVVANSTADNSSSILTEEYQAYEDLVSYRKHSNSPSPKPQITSNQKSEFMQQSYVVGELFETERNYVRTLSELLTEYSTVLNVIAEPKCDIAQNLHAILKLHTSLFARLADICEENCVQNQSESVAQLFIEFQDQFLIYGDYCTALNDALKAVKSLKRSESGCYERLITPIRNGNVKSVEQIRRFRVEDLLVVPFQRVLKYNMLLTNLLKEVSSNDQNNESRRKTIRDAVDRTADVNKYINEIKRDNENLKIINEFRNKFCNIDLPTCLFGLHDYGRYLMDGRIKLAFKKPVDFSTRTAFVFEKLILICKRKGESYLFKELINLDRMRLEEDFNGSDKKHMFVLRDKHFSSNRYFFVCKSASDLNTWKQKISDSINNLDGFGLMINGHNLVYTSFGKEDLRCDQCQKYFTGLLLQGFRCKTCWRKVHKECINLMSENCRKPSFSNKDISNINHLHAIGAPLIHRRQLNGRHPQSFRVPQSDKKVSFRQKGSNRMRIRHAHSIIGNPEHLKGFVQVVYPTSSVSLRPDNKMFPMLAVSPGDVINVLEDDDEDWWMGSNVSSGDYGWFPSIVVQPIKVRHQSNDDNCGLWRNEWFLDIPREAAEMILAKSNIPNDTFLVRPRRTSSNPECLYSLSLKHGDGIYHIRIQQEFTECSEKPKVFISRHCLFASIEDLINYYMKNSLEPFFQPIKSALVTPIKRLNINWFQEAH